MVNYRAVQEIRECILQCERDLLHAIGFDFNVEHPLAYGERYFEDYLRTTFVFFSEI